MYVYLHVNTTREAETAVKCCFMEKARIYIVALAAKGNYGSSDNTWILIKQFVDAEADVSGRTDSAVGLL